MENNIKKALVSVIMPAYNAENTIAKAIHSVLQQDYANIELIVVNDGSTDETEVVSKSIIDNRLKIVNQNNLGLSGARNTGLSHVNGDFVAFVDSDDWVEPNYLSLLYESLVENNASMSICGMVRDLPNNSHQCISFKSSSSFTDCFNNEDFLSLFEGGLINSCCNKLYRRGIINNNKISFSGKVLVEDIEFNLQYLKFSVIVNTLKDCPYHYVTEDNSLTTKVSEEMFQNYMGIQTLFFESLSDEHKVYANRFVYHQYVSLFFKYLSKVASGLSTKKDVYPILKKYIRKSLIRQAFKSHSYTNYKELVVSKCIQYGLFNVLLLYLKRKMG